METSVLEEIPSVPGQGRRPGGDTPRSKPEARGGSGEEQPTPRPGAVAGRTNLTSKEPWLHRRRRA